MRRVVFALLGLVRVVCVVVAAGLIMSVCNEVAPGEVEERAARAAGALPAAEGTLSPQQRAALIANVVDSYGIHERAHLRVLSETAQLLRMDLGRSWRDGRPLTPWIGARVLRTLALIGAALCLAVFVGVVVAVWAVLGQRRRAVQVAAAVVGTLAITVPPLWIAVVGLRVFVAGHPWSFLPLTPAEGGAAWLLPIVSISLAPAFVIAEHLRVSLRKDLYADYAVAARAKGASERRVVVAHILRVHLAELLPLFAVLVGYLLGAAAVVERIFGLDGVGAALLDAAGTGDAPAVRATCVVFAMIVAVATWLAQCGQRWLDPRTRFDEVL